MVCLLWSQPDEIVKKQVKNKQEKSKSCFFLACFLPSDCKKQARKKQDPILIIVGFILFVSCNFLGIILGNNCWIYQPDKIFKKQARNKQEKSMMFGRVGLDNINFIIQ